MTWLKRFLVQSVRSKKQDHATRNRKLELESLENRELLSVSMMEFEMLRSTYDTWNLSDDRGDYNIIEIAADRLTATELRAALDEAGRTVEDDLIVLRTTEENDTLALDGKPILVDVDSERFGSVMIVGIPGSSPKILANNDGITSVTVRSGDVRLGGVDVVGIDMSDLTNLQRQFSVEVVSAVSAVNTAFIEMSDVRLYDRDGNDVTDLDVFELRSQEMDERLRLAEESENNDSYTNAVGGNNYVVLFSGGGDKYDNRADYYLAVKDLYTVCVADYNIPKSNIYVLYADGTNPADDMVLNWTNTPAVDGRFGNSDMSFASGSTVLEATAASLSTVFTTLGGKMQSGDHLLFFTHDHGAGNVNKTSDMNDYLVGWQKDQSTDPIIAGSTVANELFKIKQGNVTCVFGQCFSGGILDDVFNPSTGTLRNSGVQGEWYGMAATNHYEYSLTEPYIGPNNNNIGGYGFAQAFVDAIRGGNRNNTVAAYNYTFDKDPYTASGTWSRNGGTYAQGVEHPWAAGKNFSIFATASSVAAPTNFRSTGKTSSGVTLEWSAASGATQYEIQYKKSSSSDGWTPMILGNVMKTTVPSLEANTAYDFRIRTISSGKTSDWADPVRVTTSHAIVYDTGIKAGDVIETAYSRILGGTGTSTLYIKGNYAGGLYVEGSILGLAIPGSAAVLANSVVTTATTTKFVFWYDKHGTIYSRQQYTVLLNHEDGSCRVDLLDAINFKTTTYHGWFDKPSPKPVAPIDLRETNKTSDSVALAWSGSSSEYILEYRKTSVTTWTTCTAQTTTTATVPGLSAATEYEFRVRARQGSVYSDYSDPVRVTTLPSVVYDTGIKDGDVFTTTQSGSSSPSKLYVTANTDGELYLNGAFLGIDIEDAYVNSSLITTTASTTTFSFFYKKSPYYLTATITLDNANKTCTIRYQPTMTATLVERNGTFSKTHGTDKPDLVPYVPSGWSGSIVVNTDGSPTTTATKIYPSDDIYIHYSYNNSKNVAVTDAITNRITISGGSLSAPVSVQRLRSAGLSLGYYGLGSVALYEFGSLDLAPGTYTVTVRLNCDGNVDESDTGNNEYSTTFTVSSPTPVAPTSLQTREKSSQSVTVQWSGSASRYVLEYKKATDSTWQVRSPQSDTSAIVSGLVAGTAYEFRVRALEGSAYSGYSPTLAVTTDSTSVGGEDIGDTLATAGTIAFSGDKYVLAEKIGNGPFGDKDVDLFKLVVSKDDLGRTYRFETALPAGAGKQTVDTYIRLFNVAGNDIDYNDDFGDGRYSALEFTPTAAGTYYLGVSAWGNHYYNPNLTDNRYSASTGDYTLTVTRSSMTGLAVPKVTAVSQSTSSVKLTWNAVAGATHYGVWRLNAQGKWEELSKNVKTTTFTDKTAPSDTQTYAVRAYQGATYSDFEAALSLGIPKVSAMAQSTASVKLTWNVVAGATHYGVWRLNAQGKWEELGKNVKTTSFTDKTAPNDSQTYAVRAYVGTVYGGFVEARSLGIPKVTAVAQSASSTNLTWQKVEGATHYGVWRLNAQGKWVELSKNIKTTNFTDKTAPNDSQTYAVRAYVGTVYGGFVEARSLGIPKVTAMAQSASSTNLTWQKVEGATHYGVWRLKADGKWVELSKNVKTTNFTDKTAPNGTQTYAVRAYVGTLYGGFVAANTVAVPKVTALAQSETSVQLKWDKVAGATHYGVWRLNAQGKWVELSKNVKTTNFTDKTAPNGTQTYAVRAYVGNIYGGFESVLSLAVPKVATTIYSATSVRLSWNPVTGATHYGVWKLGSDGKWIELNKNVWGTEYYDYGASVAQQTYAVRAYRGSNYSGFIAVTPGVGNSILSNDDLLGRALLEFDRV